MSETYPLSLSSLSQREAIIDAVNRAFIGCDRYDKTIFNSAWAGEDVVFEIHDNEERVFNGLSSIHKYIFERVGPMDTTHNASAIRVDVQDGAKAAHVTATALAQHCPPGTGRDPNGRKYTVGGQYFLDIVKDEADEWKIKKWVLNVIWSQGDPSVMAPPSQEKAE